MLLFKQMSGPIIALVRGQHLRLIWFDCALLKQLMHAQCARPALGEPVPLKLARRLFAGAEFRGADARLVDRVDLPDEDTAPPADPALAIASWR